MPPIILFKIVPIPEFEIYDNIKDPIDDMTSPHTTPPPPKPRRVTACQNNDIIMSKITDPAVKSISIIGVVITGIAVLIIHASIDVIYPLTLVIC